MDPRVVAKQLLAAAYRRGLFARRRWRWSRRDGELVLFMCLWNRPQRLPEILRQLDAQVGGPPIHLQLWNNNRADHEIYIDHIERFQPQGALQAVTLVRSGFNTGSIGRFYLARREALRSTGARPMMVLDDDQDVPVDFVRDALAAYRPEEVAAFWAFTVASEDYYDRQPAAPGDRVDHVGPGGMICELALFRDPRFFTRMPSRFWMLDDIWFSFFVQRRGKTLRKLPVHLEFVLEETNQHWSQGDLKRDFYRLLRTAPPEL